MMFDVLAKSHPQPGSSMPGPVQWYGGKGRLSAKLIPFIDVGMPRYLEPYCGGGAVFFRKQQAGHEVLNDLDGRIVNLFRVLQDPAATKRLTERLAATPYAVAEFARALDMVTDESATAEDRAWAFFVAQNQGFGGQAKTVGRWGRNFQSFYNVAGPVSQWRTRILRLPAQAERLSRAMIDCRDAIDCLRYWQTPETLVYLDPTYVASTRAKGSQSVYAHECSDEHHIALVNALLATPSVCVLSGYDSPEYQPLTEAGWIKKMFSVSCHAASRGRGSKLRGHGAATAQVPRTECVWLSPNHPAIGLNV